MIDMAMNVVVTPTADPDSASMKFVLIKRVADVPFSMNAARDQVVKRERALVAAQSAGSRLFWFLSRRDSPYFVIHRTTVFAARAQFAPAVTIYASRSHR
jgi:hypothetical protein